MRLYVAILICLSCLNLKVRAESFNIKLQGEDLKNVSALEINLGFEPKDAFIIDREFNIGSSETLFKTIDQDNSIIRVFFYKPPKVGLVNIVGTLNRANYIGSASASIKDIKYISAFAKEVNPLEISSEIKISSDKDVLPFMGITKAEILGPSERLYSSKMVIALTNIETYGFEFNKSIKKISINDSPAKFISNNIISATLDVSEIPFDNELELILKVEVDKNLIKKKVGVIKLIN